MDFEALIFTTVNRYVGQNIGIRLVDIEELGRVSAKFVRALKDHDVYLGSIRFESLFTRPMDEYKSLWRNLHILHEGKLPDEE